MVGIEREREGKVVEEREEEVGVGVGGRLEGEDVVGDGEVEELRDCASDESQIMT